MTGLTSRISGAGIGESAVQVGVLPFQREDSSTIRVRQEIGV